MIERENNTVESAQDIWSTCCNFYCWMKSMESMEKIKERFGWKLNFSWLLEKSEGFNLMATSQFIIRDATLNLFQVFFHFLHQKPFNPDHIRLRLFQNLTQQQNRYKHMKSGNSVKATSWNFFILFPQNLIHLLTSKKQLNRFRFQSRLSLKSFDHTRYLLNILRKRNQKLYHIRAQSTVAM